MPEYIPATAKWVRDQVELYESSGGTQGVGLQDTGLPCIIVTHMGNKTGAIRKIPLMRVKDGDTCKMTDPAVHSAVEASRRPASPSAERSFFEHCSSTRWSFAFGPAGNESGRRAASDGVESVG